MIFVLKTRRHFECKKWIISPFWFHYIILLAITSESLTMSGSRTIQHSKRARVPVIRYEDNWVCVNKPAGLSVHRSANSRRNETTLRSLLKRQLARKIFPVHRLDHRTSGAILFAFDAKTTANIHRRLAEGSKEYIALLRGIWKYENKKVVIDKPLKVEGVMKDALTEFHLISSSSFCEMPCTLVSCKPITGRTHQIRRHAYQLGHPIIGDSQHGDSRVNRSWRNVRGLDRLALHCLSIQLQNDSKPCIAPIPQQMIQVLQQDIMFWEEIVNLDPRFMLHEVDERGGTYGRNYKNRVIE
mmetsp:Transcript_13841/g.21093  ORF Transcript_13841/g.21093 Transcript_13841/m.21093 type:complete len:299 (-) Transcript_13841:30-926(-)